MAMPRDTYVWKITDSELIQKMKSAKNSIRFESDVFKMHKLKWYLCVYPNGYRERYKGRARLVLWLALLPSHLSKLAVRYKMEFVEGDEMHSNKYTFDSNKMGIGYPDWFNTNKLLKFNTFTFKIIQQFKNPQILQKIGKIQKKIWPGHKLNWPGQEKVLFHEINCS